MICIRPIDIQNEKTKMWQKVPCGNCYACLGNRRNQWTFRIMNEVKDSETAYFVTLTYNDENLPIADAYGEYKMPTLDKEDLQKFNKKLRKFIMEVGEEKWLKEHKTTWSPKYRYFSVGEYGTLGDRPHYHAIMFNLPKDYVEENRLNKKLYSEVLDDIWNKGIVDVEPVNKKVAHYCAKYTLESYIYNWFKDDVRQKPFAVMSRRPGIGNNYINADNKNHFSRNKNSYTSLPGNYKQTLGRYYKDKLYPISEGIQDPSSDRAVMQRKALGYTKQSIEQERSRVNLLGFNYEKYKEIQYGNSVKKIKRNLRKNKL